MSVSMPRISSLRTQSPITHNDSFTSQSTRFTNRSKRRNLTEAEEAAVLSRATQQATTAASSILAAGGTHATALSTAKAAALSILFPKDADGGRNFVGRRKAKQQSEIIASMALLSASNSLQAQYPHPPPPGHYLPQPGHMAPRDAAIPSASPARYPMLPQQQQQQPNQDSSLLWGWVTNSPSPTHSGLLPPRPRPPSSLDSVCSHQSPADQSYICNVPSAGTGVAVTGRSGLASSKRDQPDAATTAAVAASASAIVAQSNSNNTVSGSEYFRRKQARSVDGSQDMRTAAVSPNSSTRSPAESTMSLRSRAKDLVEIALRDDPEFDKPRNDRNLHVVVDSQLSSDSSNTAGSSSLDLSTTDGGSDEYDTAGTDDEAEQRRRQLRSNNRGGIESRFSQSIPNFLDDQVVDPFLSRIASMFSCSPSGRFPSIVDQRHGQFEDYDGDEEDIVEERRTDSAGRYQLTEQVEGQATQPEQAKSTSPKRYESLAPLHQRPAQSTNGNGKVKAMNKQLQLNNVKSNKKEIVKLTSPQRKKIENRDDDESASSEDSSLILRELYASSIAQNGAQKPPTSPPTSVTANVPQHPTTARMDQSMEKAVEESVFRGLGAGWPYRVGTGGRPPPVGRAGKGRPPIASGPKSNSMALAGAIPLISNHNVIDPGTNNSDRISQSRKERGNEMFSGLQPNPSTQSDSVDSVAGSGDGGGARSNINAQSVDYRKNRFRRWTNLRRLKQKDDNNNNNAEGEAASEPTA